ncbi:tRNA lysidine(34) synthetase TilS [Pasteurellaceae bacterium 15-036681]|nr:tRNA lysidine(34) synthetase TilS [Pasteurellaceae bacterium 15-036681]
MYQKFQQQLSLHFPTQSHFLIGLSGGIDSVVLLHLFKQAQTQFNLNLRAIHIHHGLSPNADNWVDFCEQLCRQWDIPLIIKKVKVEGKQGIEAEARSARYQAIQQQIQSNEILATAHHLDDQAETFLLALKRGSGIKGLGAMQAVSFAHKLAIFRPLLAISKAEITAYAEQHNLQWINDESNECNDYDRNFLRNEVLPLLNQRWAQFNQMVTRSSQHCAEQQQLIEELLADELEKRIDLTQQSLMIDNFSDFSKAKQQQLIRLWLEKCEVVMPSIQQLEQIIENLIFAETDKNPQVKLGDKIIRRYQNRIFITRKFADTKLFSQEIPPFEKGGLGGILISLPDNIGTIQRTENALICNLSGKSYRLPLPQKLSDKSLTIKLHHSGKVAIYGKTMREDIKKIWQKNSVPVWLRTRTPLVFFEDKLVFLIN